MGSPLNQVALFASISSHTCIYSEDYYMERVRVALKEKESVAQSKNFSLDNSEDILYWNGLGLSQKSPPMEVRLNNKWFSKYLQ